MQRRSLVVLSLLLMIFMAANAADAKKLSSASGAGMGAAWPPPQAIPNGKIVSDVISGSVQFGVYDPGRAFARSSDIDIEHVFVFWQKLDKRLLRRKISYANERNRQFMVTVEPFTKARNWRDGGDRLFTRIQAGKFDKEIAAVCREVTAVSGRPIVRWGHEMEDPTGRYPWARRDSAGYIAAFRYFTEKCRKYAPRALFVWSPKGEKNLRKYYPGDDCVDLVGLSVWGLQKWDRRAYGRDRRFNEVFREKYNRVYSYGKPVIIAELGVAGNPDYRKTWFSELRTESRAFPTLRSIVYFNAKEPHHWPNGMGSPDWRIDPSHLRLTARFE